jgi:hypothetical protein
LNGSLTIVDDKSSVLVHSNFQDFSLCLEFGRIAAFFATATVPEHWSIIHEREATEVAFLTVFTFVSFQFDQRPVASPATLAASDQVWPTICQP